MAAFIKNMGLMTCPRISQALRNCGNSGIPTRGAKRWVRSVQKDWYERRIEQGPEPERHRSEWSNWNHNSEVYAFGKRLGEEFKDATLLQAFTDKSYLEKEAKRRQNLELEAENISLNLEDNAELAKQGTEVASAYIEAYLRHSLPRLPEEGIRAVREYLLSDETLSYIAANLGFKDLILCEELPPSSQTYSQSLRAVIGGLANDSGIEKAQLFVQDFIITQLADKSIDELWQIHNPMGVLADVLRAQGMGNPEPRLIFKTGSETMLAAYAVGIYSDKQLIGKSYGETVTIAEEMAARNALRQIFGIDIGQAVIKFGRDGHKLDIDMSKKNDSLEDYAKYQLS